MQVFKNSYDETYYKSINEKRLFQSSEIRNKVNLIKHFKSSGTLLELGCGEGKLLAALAQDFMVKGVDISEYCVTATNKLLGDETATQVNLDDDFPKGTYDVIVAFDVLEHLQHPEIVMQKIYRHLNVGGVFIFAVPNNFGLVGSIATRCFNFIDRTHINTWQRGKWEQSMATVTSKHETWDQIWFSFAHHPLAKYVAFDVVGVLRA